MTACGNCGSSTQNQKYCSRSCACSTNNRIHPRRQKGAQPVRPTCLRCGHFVPQKFGPDYCGYCVLSMRNTALWLAGELDGRNGSGGLACYARRYVREVHGPACWRCGWCVVHPITGRVPTQIDHIDGDRSNCAIENLQLLCPNCHSLTETFGALNRKRNGPRASWEGTKLISS